MDTGTTIVSAQVPIELRDQLLERAHDADRTLSAEIRRTLQGSIRNRAGTRVPRSDSATAPAYSDAGANALEPEPRP
jgi:hypothetical protein